MPWIQIDHREKQSRLVEELEKDPYWVLEFETLKIGDYRLSQGVVIERKTWTDFAVSLLQGRLFTQANRLASCQNSIFLLEKDDQFHQIKFKKESLQGALVTLALIYRIPILKSSNPLESLRLLRYLDEQSKKDRSLPLPRWGRRPRVLDQQKSHFLQGLGGIGAKKSLIILQKFKTLQNFINASEEEWESIPGISSGTIQKWNLLLKSCFLPKAQKTRDASHRVDGA